VSVALSTVGTTARGVRIRGSASTGRLVGRWDSRKAGARAVLRGVVGGRTIRAVLTAP